jgi:hypothetical protein
MTENQNLDEFLEWAMDSDNVNEFCANLYGDLMGKPNEFVTIREIAMKMNWEFYGYAELVCLLCYPNTVLPDIVTKEDEAYESWAYKYNPDANYTEWEHTFWYDRYGELLSEVANIFRNMREWRI